MSCGCSGAPPIKLSDRLRCMNCDLDVEIPLPEATVARAVAGDPASLRAVRAFRKCYVEREAARECPECGDSFESYRYGVSPQRVCERCGIVVPGEGGPDISW